MLSGRDDEFVACILLAYTALRWGELVGLEKDFVRDGSLRVEWQLYELDTGKLERCPPKDDSYRTLDLPAWLSQLLAEHIARTKPSPCHCHERSYVFRGHTATDGVRPGAKLNDVARHAGVSAGTASNVLNHPDLVTSSTRARVEQAIDELGYIRNAPTSRPAAHWRRSNFAAWLFGPAVSGWYPRRAPQVPHPVPVRAEPWPGIPVRGRGASQRADACWLPIARGLTPHGLRHTHRTFMEEFRTEPVLINERMGHIDGSISARYAHTTAAMRTRLSDELTRVWLASLDARREMCPRSPVAVLDALLRQRESEAGETRNHDRLPRFSLTITEDGSGAASQMGGGP